jgi:hypothetical protein
MTRKDQSSTCAGISFETILSKNVGAFGLIAGSVEAALAAASTSLMIDRSRDGKKAFL